MNLDDCIANYTSGFDVVRKITKCPKYQAPPGREERFYAKPYNLLPFICLSTQMSQIFKINKAYHRPAHPQKVVALTLSAIQISSHQIFKRESGNGQD
jgi:hypothetical protein